MKVADKDVAATRMHVPKKDEKVESSGASREDVRKAAQKIMSRYRLAIKDLARR